MPRPPRVAPSSTVRCTTLCDVALAASHALGHHFCACTYLDKVVLMLSAFPGDVWLAESVGHVHEDQSTNTLVGRNTAATTPTSRRSAGQKSEGLQEVVARLQLEQDRLRAALDAQAQRSARLREENVAMEARLASLAHVQVCRLVLDHVSSMAWSRA